MSFVRNLKRTLSLKNLTKFVTDLEIRITKLETFAGMIVQKSQEEIARREALNKPSENSFEIKYSTAATPAPQERLES